MKAVICKAYGAPEVLELKAVPKPLPKDSEVLIKIKATAVNSGDVRVRGLVVEGALKVIMRLVLGITKPRKPILGLVFSGVVEEIGPKVTKFKVGDEVYGITGFRFGTYAEYIALKESATVISKPNNATHKQAVALIFGGTTAIHFLEKAGIKDQTNKDNTKPNKVLIYGATGSVGTSAIQIAKHYGAHVTAVCSTKGIDLVRSLGADSVIDYTRENFASKDQKYEIIFDAVGKITKKQSAQTLQPKGVFVTVGGLDTASETRDQLELLKRLYETGTLKSVIDKTYTLDQIVQAHHYVDKGHKHGNVVIKVGE